jgi:hypothetical protein
VSLFSKLPKPSFTIRKSEEQTPTPFKGKALRRRQVMVREARALLPHLPQEPGDSTHALLTGRTDLTVALVEMIDHYGGKCQAMRLATLSFNKRNTAEFVALLQSGKVATLTLLCSHFFRHHNEMEYTDANRQAERFPDRWRISANRNHAKVVCLDFGRYKIVCESSANARCNGNDEQLTVIMDAELHDWHSQWIDAQVTHGEQEETESD